MPIHNIPGNIRGGADTTDYPFEHVAELFAAALDAYREHGNTAAAAVQGDGPEGGGWPKGTVNGWCVTTQGREGKAVVQAREWVSPIGEDLIMTVGVRSGKAVAHLLADPDKGAVLQARVVPGEGAA